MILYIDGVEKKPRRPRPRWEKPDTGNGDHERAAYICSRVIRVGISWQFTFEACVSEPELYLSRMSTPRSSVEDMGRVAG